MKPYLLPKHARVALEGASDIRYVPAPLGYGILHALWAVAGVGCLIIAPAHKHSAIKRVCMPGCIVQTALAKPPEHRVERVIIDLRDVGRGPASWANLALITKHARVLLLTDGPTGGQLFNGENHDH